MTETLFREQPYLRTCVSAVTRVDGDDVIVDRTVFYPRGGGQPGDRGTLTTRDGTTITVSDTFHGEAGEIRHRLEPGRASELMAGAEVTLALDWPLRYAHMRMHTCLHLLGALIPCGVTGGNISATRSRLDFDMQDSVDKDAISRKLNALINANHQVLSRWISQDTLASRPELVRTLSVAPPARAERIRLVEIPGVDLQPCGGTHVTTTAEIGSAAISKVEKKGRHNRRVHVVLL